MSSRTETIQKYFEGHMKRCATLAVPLSTRHWCFEAPEDRVHRPYGWLPPYQTARGTFVFRFCPEVIDAQTSHLDEDALEEYLEVLVFSADLHITQWERPIEERDRLIDRTLYDIGPGSMRLLNEVQMKALDEARQAAEG